MKNTNTDNQLEVVGLGYLLTYVDYSINYLVIQMYLLYTSCQYRSDPPGYPEIFFNLIQYHSNGDLKHYEKTVVSFYFLNKIFYSSSIWYLPLKNDKI